MEKHHRREQVKWYCHSKILEVVGDDSAREHRCQDNAFPTPLHAAVHVFEMHIRGSDLPQMRDCFNLGVLQFFIRHRHGQNLSANQAYEQGA